jgi:hypothetical protein
MSSKAKSSPFKFAFTGINMFISMESLWRHFKKKKFRNHPRRLFMPTSIHTYQKYLNPSDFLVSLKYIIFQCCGPGSECGSDGTVINWPPGSVSVFLSYGSNKKRQFRKSFIFF